MNFQVTFDTFFYVSNFLQWHTSFIIRKADMMFNLRYTTLKISFKIKIEKDRNALIFLPSNFLHLSNFPKFSITFRKGKKATSF